MRGEAEHGDRPELPVFAKLGQDLVAELLDQGLAFLDSVQQFVSHGPSSTYCGAFCAGSTGCFAGGARREEPAARVDVAQVR